MAIVTAHVEAVQELYVAYFNRPADYAGLDYWTNVVAANAGDTSAVSAAFAAEAEYKTEYDGMTNEQIVDKVYQNLFGRAAEAAGKDYWADLLTAGSITIDKVVAEIAAGAQTTDAEAYENKVVGATAFTNALDTPAKQTGYSGAEANAVAKTFISSITTDASLTAATAPAALTATVAAVVAAGTPFTLVSGLAALEAAQDAVADFLGDLDLDDDPDTDTVAADVGTALTAAIAAVDTEIGGAIDFATASAAVQAALIADATKARDDALVSAQEDLEEANEAVEDVDGLGAAIALLASTEDAKDAADDAVTEAAVALAAASAAFDTRNAAIVAEDIVIGASGTVTLNGTDAVDPADDTALVIVNSDGDLVLASGVTETTHPGITALRDASIAHQEALAEQTAAADALFAAELEVHLLDEGTAAEATALAGLVTEMNPAAVGTIEGGVPTAAQVLLQLDILEEAVATPGDDAADAAALADFNAALSAYMATNTDANNPLATAVQTATAAVDTATTNVEELTEAVAALEEARANADQLAALNAAVDAVEETFTDNNFKAPVTLGANAVGTAGADIFVVGAAATTTISSFGRLGADALYIGTEHTLNTGDLDDGNNSALEVFFIQSGTSVKIHLETEVYGSDSGAVAEQVITLTGVDADDLQLVNGIITLKAGTTA